MLRSAPRRRRRGSATAPGTWRGSPIRWNPGRRARPSHAGPGGWPGPRRRAGRSAPPTARRAGGRSGWSAVSSARRSARCEPGRGFVVAPEPRDSGVRQHPFGVVLEELRRERRRTRSRRASRGMLLCRPVRRELGRPGRSRRRPGSAGPPYRCRPARRDGAPAARCEVLAARRGRASSSWRRSSREQLMEPVPLARAVEWARATCSTSRSSRRRSPESAHPVTARQRSTWNRSSTDSAMRNSRRSRLAVEHLGDEEVGDHPRVPANDRTRAPDPRALQREGAELQRGGPSLGPLGEQLICRRRAGARGTWRRRRRPRPPGTRGRPGEPHRPSPGRATGPGAAAGRPGSPSRAGTSRGGARPAVRAREHRLVVDDVRDRRRRARSVRSGSASATKARRAAVIDTGASNTDSCQSDRTPGRRAVPRQERAPERARLGVLGFECGPCDLWCRRRGPVGHREALAGAGRAETSTRAAGRRFGKTPTHHDRDTKCRLRWGRSSTTARHAPRTSADAIRQEHDRHTGQSSPARWYDGPTRRAATNPRSAIFTEDSPTVGDNRSPTHPTPCPEKPGFAAEPT